MQWLLDDAAHLDGGHPVGLLTAGSFDVLIDRGLVVVADPSQENCLGRLSLTDTGAARYCELSTVQAPAGRGNSERGMRPVGVLLGGLLRACPGR